VSITSVSKCSLSLPCRTICHPFIWPARLKSCFKKRKIFLGPRLTRRTARENVRTLTRPTTRTTIRTLTVPTTRPVTVPGFHRPFRSVGDRNDSSRTKNLRRRSSPKTRRRRRTATTATPTIPPPTAPNPISAAEPTRSANSPTLRASQTRSTKSWRCRKLW